MTGYTYVEPHEDGQFLRHADVARAEHLRESVADESKSRNVTHIQEETVLGHGCTKAVRRLLGTSIAKGCGILDAAGRSGDRNGSLEAKGANRRLSKGYAQPTI